MILSTHQASAIPDLTEPSGPFYRSFKRPIYEVSAAIRALCTPGEVSLLFGLGNIMEANSYMVSAFARAHNVNPALCAHIISATMGYGKPYEELEYERLGRGKTDLWQVGTGRGVRQVSRDMAVMCAAGVVHRIVRQGDSHLFSMNLEKLLEFIREKLREHDGDNGNKSKWLRHIWSEQVEPHMAHFAGLTRKVQEFAKVVGRKTQEIIADLRNRALQISVIVKEKVVSAAKKVKEVVLAKLDESIPQVMVDCALRRDAKRDRRCGEPLFDLKGKGNGRAGLALWEKHAKDCVTKFFHVRQTGKTIGQMKKYLEELRSEGKTEEQISEHIKALMKVWTRPMSREREYDVASKFGGTRKCMLGMEPDFEIFFNDRPQITRLLFANARESEVQNIGGKQPKRFRVDFDM